MKKTQIAVLIGLAFGATAATAQQATASGSLELGVLATDKSNSEGGKMREYRDLEDGLILNGDYGVFNKSYYFNIQGDNVGRDDHFLGARGGMYDTFKYSLYNDKILHNLTLGAKSPLSGIGSDTVTFSGASPSTTIATWNTFDYRVKRDNWGGAFEWSKNSPWYLRATVDELKTRGTRPLGGAITSPGGPFIELPTPVAYTTSNFSLEGGYTTRTQQYSVNWMQSKFTNSNDFLNWRNPIQADPTILDKTTTAGGDSDYSKLSLQGLWRQLPGHSTLTARAGWGKLTNSFPVETYYYQDTAPPLFTPTSPNVTTFNGNIRYKNASVTLASQPTKQLDTRVYYNYYDRDNQSTHVIHTVGTTTYEGENSHYKKNSLGVAVGFKVAAKHKLSAGVDRTNLKPGQRPDFDNVRETKVFAEWKTNAVQNLTARLKYQVLQRRADFLWGNAGTGVNDNVYIERFMRRFDLAPMDQDSVKLMLDWSPRDYLSLGLETIFKTNKYKETTIGRTKDTRDEYYLTGTWTVPDKYSVTLFADFENVKYESYHRQFTFGTTSNADPSAAPTSTQFNWGQTIKSRNTAYGGALDVPVGARLKLRASLWIEDADGTAEFAAQNNFGTPLNIPNWDAYKKTAVNLRGIYALNKNWDMTVGLAQEHFESDDAQMSNYNYTIRTGTNQNFLSGAYAFPNYTANILYLTAKYNFR